MGFTVLAHTLPDLKHAKIKSSSRTQEDLEIPNDLRKYFKEANIDLKNSVRFETMDFLSRPVEVLWQQGTPWPSYIQSEAGFSVLVSQETALCNT
jgi:hypothetical protein